MDFSHSPCYSFQAGSMEKAKKSKPKSKSSSAIGHLSRSISGSFRSRKRRPRDLNTTFNKTNPNTSMNKSGFFDIVNKSISFMEWESWSHEAALRVASSSTNDSRQHKNPQYRNPNLNSTVACDSSISSSRKLAFHSNSGESCSEPARYYPSPRQNRHSVRTSRVPNSSLVDQSPAKYRRVTSHRQRLAPEGREVRSEFEHDKTIERADSPSPPPLPPRVPVIDSRHCHSVLEPAFEFGANIAKKNNGICYNRHSNSTAFSQKENVVDRRRRKLSSSAVIVGVKQSNSESISVLEEDNDKTCYYSNNRDKTESSDIRKVLHASVCGGFIERNTGRVYGRLYHKRHSLNSTFTHGQRSLAVHDEEPPPPSTHRLVTASSVNNMTRQGDVDDGFSNKPGRVAGWAVNFDKLLQDPVGLSVFTSFLKKEFSEENVIFWTACEQYRKISDEQHRKAQAQEIYGRHLSSKASDPVNVDSAAKLYTEKFLDNPTTIMFDVAQQQIFQLMRQDSYSRFLKSDMYKGYLVKEIEGQPLIDPTTGNPESNGDGPGKGEKKKGKGKENEEKGRRRSILPWRQYKKSSVKSTSDTELKKFGKKSKEEKVKEKEPNNNLNGDDSNNLKVVIADTSGPNPTTATTAGGQGKKGAGPGIDLSTMRKEVFHPKDKEVRDAPESQFKFCRIMLPDGSTTVVCAKPGQTCRVVLSKLCEKRSVALASVEVFLQGSSKPLDLEEDISVLGSKEIVIEKRVLFRLDMPNVKSIGVKAKPNRSVSEVFRPILQKYGFSLESITVYMTGSQDPVDLDDSVSCLDKQRATIVTSDSAESIEPGPLPLSARIAKAATTTAAGKSKNINNLVGGRGGAGGGSLEEITNQIFDDLMRGKSQLAHGFDELGVVELEKAKVNKNDEGRSLGLFGLLRKESWGTKDRRPKGKGKVTFTLPGNDTKRKKDKDGEKLIRLLSGAQELRLDDQRGTEISTGEMPSFLYQDMKNVKGSSSSNNLNLHKQQQQPGVLEVHMEEEGPVSDMMTTAGLERVMEDNPRLTKSPSKVRKQQNSITPRGSTSAWAVSTPTTVASTTTTTTPRGRNETDGLNSKITNFEKWNQHNKSFGPDSVFPSPNTASAYFQMSPEIVEMQKRSVNNQSPHNNNHSPHNNYPSSHINSYSQHNNNHSPHNLNHSRSPTDIHKDPSSFRPTPMSQFHNSIQSVHSSFYTPTKAPVASPEKFSPANKNHNNNVQAAAMLLLPSKMSPTSPSSNSSSSSSSSIRRRPSSASNNYQQQQQSQNVSRMSDGMLLHKLQMARRSNASPINSNPLSHSQHISESRNSTSAADLAQRALLSPRFNDNEESHLDMTHSQRALLSPRLNHPFPNANIANHQNASTKPTHDYYIGQRKTPSPVRNNSSSPYNKVTSNIESSFGEPRPLSSSAGPQLSNWHNRSYLIKTSPETPYYSSVKNQGTFKTDYLQEERETVTFV